MSNINVGKVDRIVRFLLGLVLVFYVIINGVGLSSLFVGGLFIVGVVLLATAIFSYCPLYNLLGIKTCRSK